jgi:hypothetical protein
MTKIGFSPKFDRFSLIISHCGIRDAKVPTPINAPSPIQRGLLGWNRWVKSTKPEYEAVYTKSPISNCEIYIIIFASIVYQIPSNVNGIKKSKM